MLQFKYFKGSSNNLYGFKNRLDLGGWVVSRKSERQQTERCSDL